MVKKVNYLILFVLMLSCSAQKQPFSFLEGTWQVEGQTAFEFWEKRNDSELIGYGYKFVDGEKKRTEELSIKKVNDHWVYHATVANQNQGATIPFTLNTDVDGRFSFENLGHDFPKKIQYEVISKEKIKAHVLGAEDKGFVLTYIKTKTE